MHLLTIMLKKMQSCFVEGSRDLKVTLVFAGNKDERLEGAQENLWCFRRESRKLQEILTAVGRIFILTWSSLNT